MRTRDFFPTRISRDQAKDTGMAMVLILLLVALFTGSTLPFKIAVPVLVVNMVWPMAMYPLAVVWLGLSHLLGTVVSKVLLSVLFFVLVTPVGLARRLMGKDILQLGRFRNGNGTVMKIRNHTYSADDIEKPY